MVITAIMANTAIIADFVTRAFTAITVIRVIRDITAIKAITTFKDNETIVPNQPLQLL